QLPALRLDVLNIEVGKLGPLPEPDNLCRKAPLDQISPCPPAGLPTMLVLAPYQPRRILDLRPHRTLPCLEGSSLSPFVWSSHAFTAGQYRLLPHKGFFCGKPESRWV